MTKSKVNANFIAILNYLSQVEKIHKSGQATEHSYRGALQNLFEALLGNDYTVINEPKRIECGAPDLVIKKSDVQIAFIEAKDLGDRDLEGQREHKTQATRYKKALDSVTFTDYLDFHFYIQERFVIQARIGILVDDKIKPLHENFTQLLEIINQIRTLKPQKISSANQLASLMANKARLLKEITYQYLKKPREEDDDERGKTLLSLYRDFRNTLNKGLDLDNFSDYYAQTLTYGFFAARLNDSTTGKFTRYKAMDLIPNSNPFLKDLFTHISTRLEDEVSWIVDDIVNLFSVSDVAKIMKDYSQDKEKRDPMIFFYEDFLAAFDGEIRRDRGVWYTPLSIVRFMVNAVDQILEEKFQLADGLANDERIDWLVLNRKPDGTETKEKINIPVVQILDPATGTGTFLAECVRQIHDKFEGNEGRWNTYVKKDLIPRLNGFELLMAPYTMAHLKLDLVLKNTGYKHRGNQRFNIFLTDSLKNDIDFKGGFYAAALRDEAVAAERVKKNYPVMVLLGNPPYKGESENRDEFIMELMKDYKKEPETDNQIRDSKWLNDDYVKFIRLAEYYIQKNNKGVIAFINPHHFLNNLTYRGMRFQLMKTFDEIYILDLHGYTRPNDASENDVKDQNVFPIQSGVSINIFVKNKANHSQCQVYYADLYGKKLFKFRMLDSHNFNMVPYKKINPTKPNYLFIPQNINQKENYEKGFGVEDLFVTYGCGITSAHDEFVTGSKTELQRKFQAFKDSRLDDNLYKKFNVKEKKGWDIKKGYKNLQSCNDISNYIMPLFYRPFDDRFIFYEDTLVWRSVHQIFDHFRNGDNIGLICKKGFSRTDTPPCFVTDRISDYRYWSCSGMQGGDYVFPLFLRSEPTCSKPNSAIQVEFDFASDKTKSIINDNQINFNQEILQKIIDKLDFIPSPQNVFDYIYAVLHTPEYSERYQDFLKEDFPKIPYPKNSDIFKRLAEIGEKLRNIHLMRDPVPTLRQNTAKFPISGTDLVEKPRYFSGKVFINDKQYFDRVPEGAYNMFIGGYQPAQKYLKDRKGCKLTGEEKKRYQRIILALYKTHILSQDLSNLSNEWL